MTGTDRTHTRTDGGPGNPPGAAAAGGGARTGGTEGPGGTGGVRDGAAPAAGGTGSPSVPASGTAGGRVTAAAAGGATGAAHGATAGTAAAAPAPAPAPVPGGGRLRWALADSWTMVRRGMAHWARQPAQVLVGLAFPVLVLVMFAGFLGGGMSLRGGGDYTEFLVPGMLALTMAFGLESTMVAVAQDLNRGVLDRFRSLPMAPSAVLVGRSVLDMLQSALGLLLVIGAGLLMGWRWHGGLADALYAVGLLLLLRFALLWLGIHLGLLAGRPEAVQAVQILVWPVAFLSNAFTEPAGMPAWLGAAAEWNPLSATAAAIRELFGNPGWEGGGWAAQHALPLAVVWPLVLLAVFFPLALRRYGRLSR